MRTTVWRRKEQVISPFGRNDNGVLGRNDTQHWWARVCATAGAGVWAGMALLTRIGVARIGAIELMFLFAPLVIVPLGMELGRVMGGGGQLEDLARRLQPVGAAIVVVAIWLPPGRRAGILALGWLMVCGLIAGGEIVRIFRREREIWGKSAGESPAPTLAVPTRVVRPRVTAIAIAVARIDLAVGAAWLVASRWGMRPMGIQEPIGLLTAVHFHFAGFATATIAAATLQFAEQRGEARRWLRVVVGLVAGMPFVVAAGFVVSPVLKMGAAILFSASVAGLAIAVRACGTKAEDGAARLLLQVAAGAVFAGMVLSATYAIADFLGSEVLTIPQMARTHGVLNAVGFCLLGLLGWLVEKSRG